MKRQADDSIASRVYVYGAVPARVAPVINEELALAQLRLAGRLWNLLVAIQHVHQGCYRKIMHDETQDRIDCLRAEAADLRAEIRARRKAARKRDVDVGDLRDRLAALKGEIVPLIEQRKADRDRLRAERATDISTLQDRTNRRIVRARQAAASLGLFWGSYNDVVQRADAARKNGGELHFQRFRGTGTLTAQVMGGASVTQCVGGSHTFFRLDPETPGQRWRYASMRIGSAPDRRPVWMRVPIVYHRDLPPAARIKSVSMTRRVLAGKVRWQLNVIVNLPKSAPKEGPAIGIDIGWRLLPEGVRVAYWQDQGGEHGQLIAPASDISEFGRVKSLRSTCDRSRDEFLPAFAAWLDGQILPPPWRERSASLCQWRSTDRLAALVAWWRENRLPGDTETYQAAVAWRKQYLHLAQWWRNLEAQLAGRSRERYRLFAAEVARDYGTVYIEDFDLAQVARKPQAEQTNGNPRSAGYRQMVSPSVFRAALLSACSREGVAVVKLPAEYTTRVCHVCGYNAEWDAAESVIHRCERCNAVWDQDRNAAINLLRCRLASGQAAPPGDQQVRQRKWDRVRDRSKSKAETVAAPRI